MARGAYSAYKLNNENEKKKAERQQRKKKNAEEKRKTEIEALKKSRFRKKVVDRR